MKESHVGCCIVGANGKPLPQFHRVRSSIPEIEAGFAPVRLERHRDGVSCQTPIAYTHDANGHKRWCIDCGAELGEQAWHPNGADVSPRGVGLLFVVVGILLALLVSVVLAALVPAGDEPVTPPRTPTTQNQPTAMVP